MVAVTNSDLSLLDAEQLRELLAHSQREVAAMKLLVEKMTHEMAVLKRLKFAAKSEAYSPEQRSLLEEAFDADIAAIEGELDKAKGKPAAADDKQQPKRQPLPANLPRREVRHEPESTTCRCGCAMKRIGEDIAEKLDYVPGVFTVERHVRGKWVCAQCETLVQKPVAPHIIDKGIPTAGLLAQVLVPSTPTTCRCTVRKRSSRVPASQFRARRSGSGSVNAACSCSRWSTLYATSC